MSRWVVGSILPGRLMPIPSMDLCGAVGRISRMQSMIILIDATGSDVIDTGQRCSRPLMSTRATLACLG